MQVTSFLLLTAWLLPRGHGQGSETLRGSTTKDTNLRSVCLELEASASYNLEDSFLKLMAIDGVAAPWQNKGVGIPSRMTMLIIFQRRCSSAVEAMTSMDTMSLNTEHDIEDNDMDAALDVYQKTALKVKDDVVVQVHKLIHELDIASSKLRARRGQFSQWSSMKVGVHLRKSQEARNSLSLILEKTGLVSRAMKESISRQLDLLAEAHITSRCESLPFAAGWRQWCVQQQSSAVSTARTEMAGAMSTSAKRLQELSVQVEALAHEFTNLEEDSKKFARIVTARLNDQDGWLSKRIKDERVKMYAKICVPICVATLGIGCAPCYAGTAAKLEGEIVPQWRHEMEVTKSNLAALANSFTGLGSTCGKLKTECVSLEGDLKSKGDAITGTMTRMDRKVAFWRLVVVKKLEKLAILLA